MKELSLEEKAKRYDEAIERAKEVYQRGYYISGDIESIFPELKESEDERIRKAIISGMTALKEQGKKTFATIHINDCIDWLEKQKPVEWSEEDGYIIEEIEAIIDAYVLEENNPKALKNWLKSIKERYTWKPSKEQIEAFEHFVRSFGESGYASPYDNSTKLLYSLLGQLKKLREE